MVNTCVFEKEKKKKGKWSACEDQILKDYVNKHGPGKWGKVAKQIGLGRCGKSVRLRWLNYLRPDIKLGNITEEEEDLIIRMHKLVGSRWSLIAGRIPGRTDNEIKNYWTSTLNRKLEKEKKKPPVKCKEIEKNLMASPADDEGHHPELTKSNEVPMFDNISDTVRDEEGGDGIRGDSNSAKITIGNDLSYMVPSNFWIMDLDESQLDVSKFPQTDHFSNFWEESEILMSFEVGGCSTINHEWPTNHWGG